MVRSPGSGDGEITRLLVAWSSGDADALEDLMPLVYSRLRAIAANFLRRERAGHTLQTTALVHEAYLLLIEQDRVVWRDQVHFFAIAGRLMRRILVDHERQRRAAKRGQGVQHADISELHEFLATQDDPDLLDLDDGLTDLAKDDPELVEIVEMFYFGGLDINAIAEVLGASRATIERRLRTARAWLKRYLDNASVEGAAVDPE